MAAPKFEPDKLFTWTNLLRGRCGYFSFQEKFREQQVVEAWAHELKAIDDRINAELSKNKNATRFSFVIDSRENHLWPFFEGQQWATRQELPSFDMVWLDASGCIVSALERKTLQDLRTSVMSGHYSDQKARMLQSAVPKHQIAFLCEGNASSASECMFDLNCEAKCIVRDGMSWRRTQHLGHTVAFLMRMTLALMQHGQQADHASGVRIPEAFENFHNPQTGLSNPKLAYLAMLSCVPGLSGPMAAAIYEVFPNMAALTKAFASSQGATLKRVENLTFTSVAKRAKQHVTGEAVKPRKIGPAVALKLCQFLEGQHEPKKPSGKKRKLSVESGAPDEQQKEVEASTEPTWADFGM